MRDNPKYRRRTCRYFSLMEIMVVVIIIGMILGLVGPNMMRRFERAKVKSAKSQIILLRSAVNDFYLDMSEYPSRLDDLITNTGNASWDGPYLDPAKVPLDPWGEAYRYECPGQHGKFDIYSYGADKAPGGDGSDADITSWE